MGILTAEMQRVVREQRLGYVATVCPDGTPNLSPKGTVTAWDDDTLVFADLRSPRTVKNLRANPAIEINVVDPMARKGYRFKGTAEVVSEGPRFEELVAFYERRGTQDARRRIRSVVLVRVTRALPVISPAYDFGATEEEVRAQWRAYWAGIERAEEGDGEGPRDA
jgi:predicted pyridoxine 5'-phosphate oxidase superfamily flavin-nucleotide-binding protein